MIESESMTQAIEANTIATKYMMVSKELMKSSGTCKHTKAYALMALNVGCANDLMGLFRPKNQEGFVVGVDYGGKEGDSHVVSKVLCDSSGAIINIELSDEEKAEVQSMIDKAVDKIEEEIV